MFPVLYATTKATSLAFAPVLRTGWRNPCWAGPLPFPFSGGEGGTKTVVPGINSTGAAGSVAGATGRGGGGGGGAEGPGTLGWEGKGVGLTLFNRKLNTPHTFSHVHSSAAFHGQNILVRSVDNQASTVVLCHEEDCSGFLTTSVDQK